MSEKQKPNDLFDAPNMLVWFMVQVLLVKPRGLKRVWELAFFVSYRDGKIGFVCSTVGSSTNYKFATCDYCSK